MHGDKQGAWLTSSDASSPRQALIQLYTQPCPRDREQQQGEARGSARFQLMPHAASKHSSGLAGVRAGVLVALVTGRHQEVVFAIVALPEDFPLTAPAVVCLFLP